MKPPKVAIFLPAYKRPEYTDECLKSVMSAGKYPNTTFHFYDEGGNYEVFKRYARPHDIIVRHESPQGLRNTIIEFFESVRNTDTEYLMKLDNDVLVPNGWQESLIDILANITCDIISPNVSETQAAFKYGKDDTYELGYRPSSVVGGLWNMHRKWIDTLMFEKADTRGIRGAFALLHQIIVLNEPRPKLGWTDKVTFDDLGHWGGSHPKHIKSAEHAEYSSEVGRPVSWNVEAGR